MGLSLNRSVLGGPRFGDFGGEALQSPASREAIAIRLRQCLEGTLAKYPPGYIRVLVEADFVPAGFRDEVCDYVLDYPELASITKEEFLVAISQIRPDYEGVLRSPQGDAWIGHVLREIPLGLPGRLLGSLGKIFGR